MVECYIKQHIFFWLRHQIAVFSYFSCRENHLRTSSGKLLPFEISIRKVLTLIWLLVQIWEKKGQSSIKVYLCLQLTDSRIVETWMPWPFLNTLFRCQSCYQLFTATKTGTSFKLSKLSTSSNSCQSCQQLVSAVQYRSTDLLGMVRARIEKCSDGCADCWKLNAVGFSTAFGS